MSRARRLHLLTQIIDPDDPMGGCLHDHAYLEPVRAYTEGGHLDAVCGCIAYHMDCSRPDIIDVNDSDERAVVVTPIEIERVLAEGTAHSYNKRRGEITYASPVYTIELETYDIFTGELHLVEPVGHWDGI